VDDEGKKKIRSTIAIAARTGGLCLFCCAIAASSGAGRSQEPAGKVSTGKRSEGKPRFLKISAANKCHGPRKAKALRGSPGKAGGVPRIAFHVASLFPAFIQLVRKPKGVNAAVLAAIGLLTSDPDRCPMHIFKRLKDGRRSKNPRSRVNPK